MYYVCNVSILIQFETNIPIGIGRFDQGFVLGIQRVDLETVFSIQPVF